MVHTEQHLRNSDFITDVVIGMSDGLTVPFALAAGVSSAVSSNDIVITAGIAEIIAGAIAIPLVPYFLTSTPGEGLKISAIVTLFCLFTFGYFKSKVTGQPLLKGAFKVMLIGAAAASAAFLVAELFGA